MDKLYIVIPAYNEQDNIEQVINDWYPVIEKHNGNGQSRLIVIDDGSKDSTYEKLKQCTKNLNRSGNEDRNMIWSSAGEKTGRMEYHVFL